MACRRAALLLLGLLALAVADEPASGDETPAEEGAEAADTEQAPLGPSEFAQTILLFPDFPDKKFIQGEFVEALCGFKNIGDKSFNITLIKGSLNSPYEYSMYIQNFTEQSPFTEIKKGEEGTLNYKFFPDPGLEPQNYVLTLTVDYVDADKEEYRTVFFNSTIEIVESQSSLDTRTFFGRILFIVFAAVVGGVGYHLYKKYASKKRSKSDVKTSSGNEWLEGFNTPGEPRRGGSGKKTSAKKSS